MYQATIYFEAYEDDFEDGQSLVCDNSWEQTLTADTQSELRNKVLEATYTKWPDLDDEQMNEYEDATEYQTSYLTNAENYGEASENEILAWKQGNHKLWSVNCHILVSEVIKRKAEL